MVACVESLGVASWEFVGWVGLRVSGFGLL
jgi:hypothetical protein